MAGSSVGTGIDGGAPVTARLGWLSDAAIDVSKLLKTCAL
jgi:hypothetical protein